MDQDLVTKIQQVIQQHPTYGYRRIWAIANVHIKLSHVLIKSEPPVLT
jgi:hypothetical protein